MDVSGISFSSLYELFSLGFAVQLVGLAGLLAVAGLPIARLLEPSPFEDDTSCPSIQQPHFRFPCSRDNRHHSPSMAPYFVIYSLQVLQQVRAMTRPERPSETISRNE